MPRPRLKLLISLSGDLRYFSSRLISGGKWGYIRNVPNPIDIMNASDKKIQVTVIIREIQRTVCQIDHKVVLQSEVTGMFAIEDIARRYRGAWAMDRDEYGTTITFANIRKGDLVHYTEMICQMSDEDRSAAWDYYYDKSDEWEREANNRRLNRDAAVKAMTQGTPEARAKVAVEYPEYQHLVVCSDNFMDDLYRQKIRELTAARKKSAPSVAAA
jgi:hypothetical protein